jgi:hypothetical protein
MPFTIATAAMTTAAMIDKICVSAIQKLLGRQGSGLCVVIYTALPTAIQTATTKYNVINIQALQKVLVLLSGTHGNVDICKCTRCARSASFAGSAPLSQLCEFGSASLAHT